MSAMTASSGIIGYGAYVPYFRLDRKAITATLGQGGGRGTRAVASYDEDTTSMGVEAARNALADTGVGMGAELGAVYFATADPAYLDKTNATAIHAALGLPQSSFAVDMGGAVRSGTGAILAATDASRSTLVVLSDTRGGLAGGSDEGTGGDAAAALVFGTGPVVCQLVAHASSTAEFLDRWRLPGAESSSMWEERFGEQEYVPLAHAAIADALKQAAITVDQVTHLIVGGVHNRAVGVIAKTAGVGTGVLVDDLTSAIGNTGTPGTALVLCDVLDRAVAGDVIVQVVASDGVDVLVWRATAALAAYREGRTTATVSAQIAGGNATLSYPLYLTWKGQLRREPPRRPDPDRPSGPPSARMTEWKFGFNGSRCLACSTRHLPPMRVCVNCHAVDEMTPERLADVPATIATFTIDRLAYSLSPPVVSAIIDFDGGGRFNCELTDVDPAEVQIGSRVQMTFRRILTGQGVHNYFWKAKPIRA